MCRVLHSHLEQVLALVRTAIVTRYGLERQQYCWTSVQNGRYRLCIAADWLLILLKAMIDDATTVGPSLFCSGPFLHKHQRASSIGLLTETPGLLSTCV